MQVNFKAFVDSLYYMGVGMLGIFIVIGAIILLTALMLRLGRRKKEGG